MTYEMNSGGAKFPAVPSDASSGACPKNMLLTGGTGFVGKAVLARLVDQPHVGKIFLLVRSKPGSDAASRVVRMVGQMFPKGRAEKLLTRIQAIDGDFTLPGLGLSEADFATLRSEVQQILHCGASTDFGAPLNDSLLSNTEGTRHMLDLAVRLKEEGILKRLDYVSTAYICGTKGGVVTEGDLDRQQTFSNSYEQSKFEAEKLVRQYEGRLDVVVYRPSIVVGHSYNGYTPHFKVLYWPILLLAKNLLPFFACNQRAYLDVVPVDYVADALVALMQQTSSVSQTFLLTAGLGSEIRIRDILRDAYSLAGIRKRPIVPFWLFDWFSRTPLTRLLPPDFWSVANLARPYYCYLRGNSVRFDPSRTLAVLQQLGVKPPRWNDYKREVLSFCLASRWGKKLPMPEYSYYLPARLSQS